VRLLTVIADSPDGDDRQLFTALVGNLRLVVPDWFESDTGQLRDDLLNICQRPPSAPH
jgi:hypothetical protein